MNSARIYFVPPAILATASHFTVQVPLVNSVYYYRMTKREREREREREGDDDDAMNEERDTSVGVLDLFFPTGNRIDGIASSINP